MFSELSNISTYIRKINRNLCTSSPQAQVKTIYRITVRQMRILLNITDGIKEQISGQFVGDYDNYRKLLLVLKLINTLEEIFLKKFV